MIEYNELYNEVKKNLSERRFLHSEAVVKRAIEYAEIYNEDIEKVKLTAIAHDIAKELSEDEIAEYVSEYRIEFDDIEKVNKNLIHAKVGAYICKNKYGFTDDMTNAVKYHTTGRSSMSMLEKIIYLADATEETRKYDSKPYVDTIKSDINKGMVDVSKWVINSLLEGNKLIHLDSVRCFNYYINK